MKIRRVYMIIWSIKLEYRANVCPCPTTESTQNTSKEEIGATFIVIKNEDDKPDIFKTT